MQLALVHKEEGYRLTVEVEEGVDTTADFEAVVLDPTGNMHAIVRRDAFEIESPAAAPALALPADGPTILSSADHAARAVRHQHMAAGYADQQMHDRDSGRAELAAFCQDRAEAHAKQARFHLFRSLDLSGAVLSCEEERG